eukprot:CAMPEP_0113535572 /NCGR_PEP_ID=MMETSP0015_2-20120614/5782_1 /TAXON_ID=2838 /ORGANISM="Odontella" /LENGTH=457 /DNA_ID=CAMNT_0000434845 /DNA_START=375 /DNA_END=1748 /DNA_ORIENTATION=- /assembly_acc=CAM_ASM_000160
MNRANPRRKRPSPRATPSSDRRDRPSGAERVLFALVFFVAITDGILYILSDGDGYFHLLQKKQFMSTKRRTHISDEKIKTLKEGSLPEGLNDTFGREYLHQMLLRAGVQVGAELISKLPLWSDMNSMYNIDDGPVITGLDTCEDFRSSIPRNQRYIGPAGMFNTGTNILASLLEKNCRIARTNETNTQGHDRYGMRWQVPWGKHVFASWRGVNVAYVDAKRGIFTDPSLVLPVVTVKDPYSWMGSMCRHPYAAIWQHRSEHCPNLLPTKDDRKKGIRGTGPENTISVRVRFKAENVTHHSSLVGLWNDWYRAYHSDASYPRLIVRYEDILVHPERVIEAVCRCAGGDTNMDGFTFSDVNGKGNHGPHAGSNGLISALIRYGNVSKRQEGFSSDDLNYAENVLDSNLMQAYKYSLPQIRHNEFQVTIQHHIIHGAIAHYVVLNALSIALWAMNIQKHY